MSSIYGLFDIGKLGLLANQLALQVTGQNIANVNTPGYSRQDAILEATTPINAEPGQLGTGVEVTEIRRIFDQFIEAQVTLGASTLGRLEIEQRSLGRVESLFNELQGGGINRSITDFFAAFQDLSTNPQNHPERVVLLESARTLAQHFVTTDTQLDQIRTDLNNEIKETLKEINSIASQIAELNSQISLVENSEQNANDLRDQRGLLVNQLSNKIDIQIFENSQGQVTVMVAGGKPLVETVNSYSLQGIPNADNKGFVDVSFLSGSGSATIINNSLTGGEIKGMLTLRDTTIPGFIDQLDRLAGAIINEVNQQHRVGFGLDGSTGNNFFSPLSPTISALNANTGSGVISATITAPSSLSLAPYRLSFSGSNYTIQNLTSGTSTTAAYSNPTVVSFEGIQFNLSGAPASGDIFNVSANLGSAGSMAVSLSDPNQIAASSSLAGIPGNNGNALLLAQVQSASVTALGGTSLQSFYSGFVGEIGSKSQSAQRSLEGQELISLQLKNRREEISGVSLDEELTNLIKFQRAYEASARILATADEILQTILTLGQ